ncbi:MAG: recombinase family protein [Firmicutes bacterium]|nr:recombinase family protein [Bacillota bacterium]
MDVCIYLIKSRTDDNMSVEEVLSKHKTTLLALAQKNKYNILDIKEEIVSGESIARRPKMLELLKEVEDNKYDAVLVMDMDRLGRGNMREQGLILETFKEYNTKIMTPNKIYDLDNEFDEEYSEFEAFMARRELKIIKKRLHRGRMKSLEEDNYIASVAPFGYIKKGTTLFINKRQSDIVKLIFNLYVNKDFGDAKIAKYLIENNIPNANNNLNWDKTTIRTILKNPVYTGKVVWGKRRFKYDKKGNRTSELQDMDDWKIYDGKHETIIDEKIFNKAQAIAKKRHHPRVHSRKKLRNPLVGIIKCGGCGATMTIRTCKNKPDSIRCYKNCGKIKSSYIYLIEERVLSITLKELKKLKYEFKYKRNYIENNTEITALKSTIQTKKNELITINQQKDKLYDLLEQGIYSNSTFLDRMKTLSSKINSINRDIEDLETKISFINKLEHLKKNTLPWFNYY